MSTRVRIFRHEAGRVAGPPAFVYVVLTVLCLALGHWSAETYQAVLLWPANGVLLAAYLQLPRRRATAILILVLRLEYGELRLLRRRLAVSLDQSTS